MFLSNDLPVMSFPKLVNMAKKHTLFSNFARFCTPKRCTRVHCLVLKNNPNYVNFFNQVYIQLQIQVPPPPELHVCRSIDLWGGGGGGRQKIVEYGGLYIRLQFSSHSVLFTMFSTGSYIYLNFT